MSIYRGGPLVRDPSLARARAEHDRGHAGRGGHAARRFPALRALGARRRTAEPPADARFRELTAGIAARLHDLCGGGFDHCLRPDDWAPGQALGRSLRAEGGDGIPYPSVRWDGGRAVALF